MVLVRVLDGEPLKDCSCKAKKINKINVEDLGGWHS